MVKATTYAKLANMYQNETIQINHLLISLLNQYRRIEINNA
jgi:hypothetical protein